MSDTIDPSDAADASVSAGMIAQSDEIGIDIAKQEVNTTIMVETEDNQLFEMVIKKPEKGVVEVTGTEPRLKFAVLGVLTHSFTDDKRTQIDHWIGQLLRMSIVFKNGSYESQPVIHVSIKGVAADGRGWRFDVF